MPVQENAQPQAETKQTNKERLKEITDSIEKGIKELFDSDKYKAERITLLVPSSLEMLSARAAVLRIMAVCPLR
ncbi:MAG TPA: hypothetical protein DF364_06275 [Ruminococcaceae bacterium]|nr:hypothetical protein [Oscillospiraceae bacterium]